MFYHKVYMNQIHSSSLLCQLASMWKNQVLCDAVIKAGNSHIKAHRVVLVAACPMLHSMKNASVGSNLEVRLAADIKADAINTFLQYLYEGFMMLTEENTKDVEKIARVLQVDSVLKCCADFYKCLHSGDKYEYSFHDNAEFKHVRASDLLKVHERNKRTSEVQPPSPGAKRQRIQSRGSSDSFNDFGASDPWDRVPREGLMGSSSARTTQPGIIEIMEDSVEIVHSDKPEDSGGTRRDNPQDRMSISVASQMKANNDVQIINASSGSEPPPRITASSSESSRFSSHPSFSHSQGSSSLGFRHDPNFTNPNSASSSRLPSSPSTHSRMPSPSSAYHLPQRTSAHSQPKPFAAGNAAQASKSYNTPSPGDQSRSTSQDQSRVTAGASTVSFSSSSSSLGGPPPSSPSSSTQAPQPVALWRSTSSDAVASGSTAGSQISEKPLLHRSESTPATSDADISIVKVESEVSFDEQFHGDDPGVTFEPDDQSGDWNREDTSNEESNASEDKMPQWMADSMKANTTDDRPSPSGDQSGGRSKLSEYIDKLHELQTKAMYFDMMRNKPKTSASTDPGEDMETADSSSEVLKGLDLTIRSSQQKHVPIYNKDRKYTPCLYCGRLKNRTRSGWRVNTFYRCLQCDVPLCVNDRNCFVLYHKYFLGMTNVENPGRRKSRDTGHVDVKKETNG